MTFLKLEDALLSVKYNTVFIQQYHLPRGFNQNTVDAVRLGQ